ncbi:MAG: hypothetical protein ACXWBP_12150, partial [Limisphaerales bacterium]
MSNRLPVITTSLRVDFNPPLGCDFTGGLHWLKLIKPPLPICVSPVELVRNRSQMVRGDRASPSVVIS